jgi:hypothetical protein
VAAFTAIARLIAVMLVMFTNANASLAGKRSTD